LPNGHPLRPTIFDRSGVQGLPRYVVDRDDRPLVYATLGTIFNRATRVFRAILDGLRDAPVELVLTVGRNVDPRELGEQPPHVHIERYVPQSLILPYCSAVITHAGFNTTMASLSHGLPVCCLPLGGDQGVNAVRCTQLGVGLSCAPDPACIRSAVQRLLVEDDFRARAAVLRAEIEAMPGPDAASDLIERLASGETVTPLASRQRA
jgi:MGT family glycosyltransferase